MASRCRLIAALVLLAALACACTQAGSDDDVFLIPTDQRNSESFDEVEPNDDLDAAAANNSVTLTVGTTYLVGNLTKDDDVVDDFLVTVPPERSGVVTVRLEMNAGSNLDLELFEVLSNGTLESVGRSERNGSSDELLTLAALKNVGYLLEVRHRAGARCFYTATVKFQ